MEEYIANAVRYEADKCPLALAIRGLGYNAEVGCISVSFVFEKFIYRTVLSQELYQWVYAFDKREDVQPIDFELEFIKYGEFRAISSSVRAGFL